MIGMWMGVSTALAGEVHAVELAVGAVHAGTPDFAYGDLAGNAGLWHAAYRQRRYGDLGTRLPKAEYQILLEGGLFPSARFDGAAAVASPPDDESYFYLRLAAGAQWSVGRFDVGAWAIRPHLGLGMQLPVHLFEVSIASAVPGAGGWNVGAYGDVYGASLGAKAESGGWTVDARFDLMFGPFLGMAAWPGSFGDLGGEFVEGGTDNLKHTARYTRVELRAERTQGISPFVTLAFDRYRMNLRGTPPGVEDPLRVGGPSVVVGITLRNKLALVDAPRAPRAVAGDASEQGLIDAIDRGRSDRALALIAAGAPPNAAHPRNGTALGLAAAAGDLAVLDALLAAGADVDRGAPENGLTPLMQAAGAGQVAAIERLLAASAVIERRDTNGGLTALLHACQMGQPAAVDRLLGAGADRGARSLVDAAGNGGHDCAAWAARGFGSADAKASIAARLAAP